MEYFDMFGSKCFHRGSLKDVGYTNRASLEQFSKYIRYSVKIICYIEFK